MHVNSSPMTAPELLPSYQIYKSLLNSTELRVPGDVLIDAAIRALGPNVTLLVTIHVNKGLWGETVSVSAQSLDDALGQIEAKFHVKAFRSLGAALNNNGSAVEGVVKSFGDVVFSISPYTFPRQPIIVKTTNVSKSLALLDRIYAMLPNGERPRAVIYWVPYMLNDDELDRLRSAAIEMEKEIGAVERRDMIHILVWSGPLALVFPYINGTPPDKSTAERAVARYFQLAGFCKSPVIVEFWPETGYRNAVSSQQIPTPMPLLVALAAAVAASVAVVYILRKNT
ncbi:MAG: hypothetical protein ACP5I3_02415 [Thermoproteus sp.]